MKHHAVYVEFDAKHPTPVKIAEVRDFLEQTGYSPAVGTSPAGRLDVQLTVPGENVFMALSSGVASAQQLAGASAIRIEALDGNEHDALQGFEQIPDLVSLSQASELLGVSRQRVQQMVDAGRFRTARKVGSQTVIAMTEVQDMATRRDAE